MRAWLWVAITGCTSHGSTPFDPISDASLDGAAGDDAPVWENRQVNAVVVGASRVAWSQSSDTCPLEGSGCPHMGATLLSADLATGVVERAVESRFGANGIAGADDVFVITGNHDSRLLRSRPDAAPELISTPWPTLSSPGAAPAVDDTHVYWLDESTQYLLRRASRSGDGSDATTIAMTELRPDRLMTFAGFLWWSTDNMTFRVAVTGGVPETVSLRGSILTTSPSRAFVVRQRDPGVPTEYQIVTLAPDGTVDLVVDHITQLQAPQSLVVDGSELFWRGFDGEIYRMSSSQTEPVLVPGGADSSRAWAPFNVTSTSILVHFTRDGFERLPR